MQQHLVAQLLTQYVTDTCIHVYFILDRAARTVAYDINTQTYRLIIMCAHKIVMHYRRSIYLHTVVVHIYIYIYIHQMAVLFRLYLSA